MSYGSTFVPFEAHGRISSKLQRPTFKKETHDRSTAKLVQYEKEFDVNLSRIGSPLLEKPTSLRDSMVAYSHKMRSIQDARIANGNAKGDPLFVRAKHIPKYPVRAPKKRRPMSFDELLGRDRDAPRQRPTGAKQRPHSDKVKPSRDGESEKSSKKDTDLHLPLLTERLRKTGQNVHVSLVSASDLYDIVDFSLRNKGTRSDSLQMLRMENELNENHQSNNSSDRYPRSQNHAVEPIVTGEAYDKYERTRDHSYKSSSGDKRIMQFEDSNNNHIPSDEFYKDTFGISGYDSRPPPESRGTSGFKLPAIKIDSFKRRPQRAKRMQLYDPGLGDIPEDNVLDTWDKQINGLNAYNSPRTVTSPPPPKQSPRHVEISSAQSLDAIQETSEKNLEKNKSDQTWYGSSYVNADNSSHEMDSNNYTNPWTNDTIDVNDAERLTARARERRNVLQIGGNPKSTKKILIRDDSDVRIEVTQCPPKQEPVNTKLKAQKRFKKLIFLRDAPK